MKTMVLCLVACWCIAATGCVSTPKSAARNSGPTGRGETTTAPRKAPPRLSAEEQKATEIADQLARDAADFREFQANRSKPTADEPVAAQAPPKPARPEVAFNDRPATTPSAAAKSSAALPGATLPGDKPIVQPVLGKDPATAPLVDERAGDPDRIREEIVRLSRELYRRAADADSPLPDLMAIVALSLADPDRPFDAEALPGVSAREKELLTAFHHFCVNLSRELRTSGDPEIMVAQTQKLKEALRAEPALRIERADLCTRVGGFGDYDRFEKNVFLAANGQRVIVYTEIQEFTSEQNSKSEWVTDLSVELVIYSDRDGIPVWKQAWQPAPDVSKNRRRDFFLTQVIGLSDHLSLGAYTLKVRVRDEKSGAVAEQGIPFQMVADPGMAVTFPKK
jgi:hypothetical protein